MIKNLQIKRDELAEKNYPTRHRDYDRFYDTQREYFIEGFNSACEILLPLIDILGSCLPDIPDDRGEHTHLGYNLDHKDCDDIRNALSKVKSVLYPTQEQEK